MIEKFEIDGVLVVIKNGKRELRIPSDMTGKKLKIWLEENNMKWFKKIKTK